MTKSKGKMFEILEAAVYRCVALNAYPSRSIGKYVIKLHSNLCMYTYVHRAKVQLRYLHNCGHMHVGIVRGIRDILYMCHCTFKCRSIWFTMCRTPNQVGLQRYDVMPVITMCAW